MKTCLVTTTINRPDVLRLYRAYGPDVEFFVAFDNKTPSEAERLCLDIGAHVLMPAKDDERWQCSQLIGRNTIGRRSIAILEALKWGADIIVTVDDDNLPLDGLYFEAFENVLAYLFNGLQVGTRRLGFDVGQWQFPINGRPVVQRGFPQGQISADNLSIVTNAKVGVAQGICLGDPDTSAVDRLSQNPFVHQVSQLLHAGVVTNPDAWTVFNTQNTAFVRELAPCFLLPPAFKRYDDIFAGLIAQRVMRHTGHVVHFGKPFAVQQRNQHNLVTDLQNEMWGMENIHAMVRWLDGINFATDATVLDMVQLIYMKMDSLPWMPEGVGILGEAWVADCAVAL